MKTNDELLEYFEGIYNIAKESIKRDYNDCIRKRLLEALEKRSATIKSALSSAYGGLDEDEAFRYRILNSKIFTCIPGVDDKLTPYNCIDLSRDNMLICFGGIGWKDGETLYKPHVIKINDYKKNWWFGEDLSKEQLRNINNDIVY